jgi:hypothetical protein
MHEARLGTGRIHYPHELTPLVKRLLTFGRAPTWLVGGCRQAS